MSSLQKERKQQKRGKYGLMVAGGRLEKVHKFCYPGVGLDCEAGVKRTVGATTIRAWKNEDGKLSEQKYPTEEQWCL